MNRRSIIYIVVAALLVALGLGAFTAANASSKCVPHKPWTETIHHPEVSHVVHHPEVTHVVHHPEVSHVVHHDAIPATPDLWWNWSPNHTQEPQDYEPAFPVDDRGTWQGPHENGGPDQDTYGTFNSSHGESGNSSWFHREHGTAEVPAWDETVVDQEAYDETVVDQEAYDETVVDQAAYDEVIKHPGNKCDPNTPPKPPVVVIVNTPPTKPQFIPNVAPPATITKKVAVPTVIDAGL